jgi:hypothetical protein
MYKSTFTGVNPRKPPHQFWTNIFQRLGGAKYIEWGRFFPRSFSEAFVPHGGLKNPVNLPFPPHGGLKSPHFAPLFPKVDFPKVDFLKGSIILKR